MEFKGYIGPKFRDACNDSYLHGFMEGFDTALRINGVYESEEDDFRDDICEEDDSDIEVLKDQ